MRMRDGYKCRCEVQNSVESRERARGGANRASRIRGYDFDFDFISEDSRQTATMLDIKHGSPHIERQRDEHKR
jgi:hypothetical protein